MKISDENDDSEDNVKKQIQFDQYEEKEVVELDFDQVRDYINMIERLKLELNHQKNKENDLKKEIGNLIKMIQKLNQSNEKQKFEMQEYINEKKIHEEAFTNRIVELGSQIQSYKQEIQQLKNKIQIQEEQDVIQDTIKSQRQQMAEMERFSQQQMEDKKCLERLISEMMIEKAQQQSPQKRTLQSENFNSPKQQIYSKDFKHLMPQNDYEQMLSDIYNKTNHMQKKNVQNEITQINKDSIDRQIKLQNEYDKLMLQINNRSKVDYLGFQKNDIAEISDHFQNVYNHNLKKSSQSIQSITSPYRAHNSSSPYIAHCDENQPKESQSQEQNQVEKGGQKNKKLHTNNELKSQESYQYSPLSQKQKFINNSPNIVASPNKNLNLQGYIGEPQSIQKYNDALNILRNSKKSQFFSSSKKQQDPSSTEENYRNIQKQITDYINQEKLLFN